MHSESLAELSRRCSHRLYFSVGASQKVFNIQQSWTKKTEVEMPHLGDGR